MDGRGTGDYGRVRTPHDILGVIMAKIDQLCLPGTVKEVDYAAGYARVAMLTTSGQGITTDWLRWVEDCAGDDRVWSPPTAGETVLVFSPSGNLNHGVIFGKINTVDYPPISDDPLIRRKTFGKPKDEEFWKYAFWELFKKQGKTHEWWYQPKDGELKWQIGEETDKQVMVHFTKDKLQFRIGDTQLVLERSGATLSVADDINSPGQISEIRLTLDGAEIHADHKASVRVSTKDASLTSLRPNVELQVSGESVIYLDRERIGLSHLKNSVLTLSAGKAIMEVKSAKSQLLLTNGISSMFLDGVSVTLTPNFARMGMIGSNVEVDPSLISLAADQTAISQMPLISSSSDAPRFADGGQPVTPHPPIPKAPKPLDRAWIVEESKKAPYYPRTGKPKV